MTHIPVRTYISYIVIDRYYCTLQNLKHCSLLVSNCSYGLGSRIKLQYTRKIIDAIHSGSLLDAEYMKTEIFGLEIPLEVEGVPSEILDPVNTVSFYPIYIYIAPFPIYPLTILTGSLI